jgi:hypothetical protein
MARSRLSLSTSGDTGAKSFRFKDANFPALVIGMEHGNPVHVPDQFARDSNPKGKPMREREWDVGKSKGLPVMGSIGIELEGDIIPRESGQTSNGSFFAGSTGGLFEFGNAKERVLQNVCPQNPFSSPMGNYPLERMGEADRKAPVPYCKGISGREEEQGQILATHPDPLAGRQSSCGPAGDD